MRVKYPRTLHLPWSLGVQSDDKMLSDCNHFHGKEVVVTEKMDGENCVGYADGYVHARSIDSRGGVDRDWVKNFLTGKVCHELPTGWRICGENLWAKHSIAYEELESFFQCFSIWDEQNVCLSHDDTVAWCEMLGVSRVKTIWRGIFDEAEIRKLANGLDLEKTEGYVLRLADSFAYDDFSISVAKFVRDNHVQTDRHWRSAQFVPNLMKANHV